MPADHLHKYQVRFPDGHETALKRIELSLHKRQHDEGLHDAAALLDECDLYQHVIYRCLVASRAYGLAHDDSDEDRRGVSVTGEMHWSLFGVPEQLEMPWEKVDAWRLRLHEEFESAFRQSKLSERLA